MSGIARRSWWAAAICIWLALACNRTGSADGLAVQDPATHEPAGAESRANCLFPRGLVPALDARGAPTGALAEADLATLRSLFSQDMARDDKVLSIEVSEDRSRAMVIVARHCGALCGDGHVFVLEKTGATWTVRCQGVIAF